MCNYYVFAQAADALKKEVQKLSAMKPHHRIVTYVGTCYAMHPTFNVQSLYVFTEFMPGVSLIFIIIMNYVIAVTIIMHTGITVFLPHKEGPTW